MTPTQAILYTLIVVTNGSDVKHSRGFETLHMCEQAKSLAMTGKTIEQFQAEKDAYKALCADYTNKNNDYTCGRMTVWADCFSRDGVTPDRVHGRWVCKAKNDAKFAQCIIEPPPQEATR